jgi:hypothetical protein
VVINDKEMPQAECAEHSKEGKRGLKVGVRSLLECFFYGSSFEDQGWGRVEVLSEVDPIRQAIVWDP